MSALVPSSSQSNLILSHTGFEFEAYKLPCKGLARVTVAVWRRLGGHLLDHGAELVQGGLLVLLTARISLLTMSCQLLNFQTVVLLSKAINVHALVSCRENGGKRFLRMHKHVNGARTVLPLPC